MYQLPAPAIIHPAAPTTSAMAKAAALTHKPLRESTAIGRGDSSDCTAEGLEGTGSAAAVAALAGIGAFAANAIKADGMPSRPAATGACSSGATSVGANVVGSAPMHSMQNLATERFSVPQDGQTSAIRLPRRRPRRP
ncbi:hypothetical protein QTI66_14870 [Variovorax sp. J22R133]|uniref:hypothetical protein n=1 Tax=Variovorax brevis TaxID=3053503 RepID=UPI0025769DDF|nr:hypothetical protein [Variovorax sp. J22R133]MDM0113439.1 hypothetical protein [Variovorax sp. J22R133]